MKLYLPARKVHAAAEAAISAIEADRAKGMTKWVADARAKKWLTWSTRWPFFTLEHPHDEAHAVKLSVFPGCGYYHAKTLYYRQYEECRNLRAGAKAMMLETDPAFVEVSLEDFNWIRSFYEGL